MTLDNAMVLHAHFLTIGRLDKAAELEVRYPSLKKKKSEAKDGKVRKG